VHPYDDPDVIAGQGTIAMEILRQHNGAIDAIFVPVGGGGIAAGIAAYVKYVRPEIKIIAVEPEDAACLAAAMKAGKRVKLDHVGLFADGVAVSQIGAETFKVLKHHVDEVITAAPMKCAPPSRIFLTTPARLPSLPAHWRWPA
jgi:threonine dehydratase